MLFDDNLGFINYNIVPNVKPVPKKDELTSVEDGFNRGNMFKNLYVPYKNYTYLKVMPKSREKELLYEVMALSFAINDLNLYLDLHPNDTEMLTKFRALVEKSTEKEMEYVKNFGPLELVDNDSKKEFTWVKNPWPWDDAGGIKYV